MEEEKIGTVLMSSKGLRRLSDTMDMIYPKQTIRLPLWKYDESLYFQLVKGSGDINLK